MPQPKRVRFYLDPETRKRAQAGDHNFIRRIENVLKPSGFALSYHLNSLPEQLKAATRRGYSLSEMTSPPNARGLTFRRVYHYPFWQIQATDKRWDWDVARQHFDPSYADADEATRFFRFWQKRIAGPLLNETADDGFVYIPLQGRLLDQRSFQTCAPLDMVARVRNACPDRQIIATLHPKESYTAAELDALDQMEKRDSGLSVRRGGCDALLPRCTFVVCMNSSIAFDGMFFGKPAILFGQSDFHHVMLDGQDPDVFRKVQTHRPNYAAYIWWVWQHMAINAGHDSAEDKIAAKLKAAGWPLS